MDIMDITHIFITIETEIPRNLKQLHGMQTRTYALPVKPPMFLAHTLLLCFLIWILFQFLDSPLWRLTFYFTTN